MTAVTVAAEGETITTWRAMLRRAGRSGGAWRRACLAIPAEHRPVGQPWALLVEIVDWTGGPVGAVVVLVAFATAFALVATLVVVDRDPGRGWLLAVVLLFAAAVMALGAGVPQHPCRR